MAERQHGRPPRPLREWCKYSTTPPAKGQS
nr:MAG TPA: hypothetical protein [Caudoviricetes sp.]